MKGREAKFILVEEYGETCFLGGIVSKKNPLTIHHLVPVRSGGQTILVNLALLCRLQHDMFNVIESYNPRDAKEINDFFRYFKETKDLEALKQMRDYVNTQIRDMGYHVESHGKLLVLRH